MHGRPCKKRALSPDIIRRFGNIFAAVLLNWTPLLSQLRQWTGSALFQVMACRQAITWTNTDLLSSGPFRAHFSEILRKIQRIPFMKMRNGGHFAKS